jgi:hypothetical protein
MVELALSVHPSRPAAPNVSKTLLGSVRIMMAIIIIAPIVAEGDTCWSQCPVLSPQSCSSPLTSGLHATTHLVCFNETSRVVIVYFELFASYVV